MTKRVYTQVKELYPEVERLRNKGFTQKEIAEQLNLRHESVVTGLIKRECKRERNVEAGQPPKQRGCKPAVTLQDYKYECKRLKMENELLRDFLYLAGRR